MPTRNKKLLLMLALVLMVRAAGAESPMSLTVQAAAVSKYVFRGVEAGGAAVQPSVEWEWQDFSGGVWLSQGIGGRGQAEREVDVFGNYRGTWGEGGRWDAGLTLYHYPNRGLAPQGKRYTWEPYLSLGREVAGFSPALALFYDATLKTTTIQVQSGYSMPLKNLGASLDLAASVGRVEPDRGAGHTYVGLGLNVPCRVARSVTVSVGLDYAHNNLPAGRRHLFSARAGVSYAFP